jgi:hypothetical protein
VAGDRFLRETTGQAEVPLFAGADGKPCRKGGDARFVFRACFQNPRNYGARDLIGERA